MKIEFLGDISDSGRFSKADPSQLMRLYDFDYLQARKLRHAIQTRIIENNNKLVLMTLDFIQSINCNLILQLSETDDGITTFDNKNFVCSLTTEKYKEMLLLMEPFCDKDVYGYQWLYDLDTAIDLLFSPGGSW